jgi:uncharacterized protein with HEPN domain
VIRDEKLYLVHILECIANIEEDTPDGRDSFFGSRTVRDSVMRNLQILAESTIRVSDDRKANYPEVDWRRIRKFRHVAVHDYMGIDNNVVWQIVADHLPILKAAVSRMLAEL